MHFVLLLASHASRTAKVSLDRVTEFLNQGWGVVQDYYKSHVFPQTSTTTLSTLGSMSTWVGVVTVTAFAYQAFSLRFAP